MYEPSNHPRARWDIFCRVVDNLGDIGVCWRLARQLAREHGRRVRLWVDEPAAFRRLCPHAPATAPPLVVDDVAVCQWDEPLAFGEVADVVVEAFACDPPEAYLQAMAVRAPAPLWINLEYLSAESWVADWHRMRSPHPRLPLVKYFFFPGFDARTGGLLRETGLLRSRDAFRADPDGPAALLRRLGVTERSADALMVSLFAYAQPGLPALMRAWAHGPRTIVLLVPEGRIVADVAAFFGVPSLPVGSCRRVGRLSVAIVPFVGQDDYDRLLWSCGLNFVRGEDSFVRAQWAARPFVWQIYAQREAAHLGKLEAFLARFGAGLDGTVAAALRRFWQAWNRDDAAAGAALAASWPAFAAALPALERHGGDWADALAVGDDLATALVKFSELSVK
jgi:uncharacterized repeat protein (TIGR03837 family)